MAEAAGQARTDKVFDVAVIGGGINGCGIAADAAARGLSVVLFEAADLGGGTSSASSKLIHGGLRYLEQYEFRLVREALAEREVLLAKAPHIVWPMRFVLPHTSGMRPAWMLRLGLFIYDHLAQRRAIPPSRPINLMRSAAGTPLSRDLTLGFSYWDCWVDDARLVVTNAIAAREAGALILTRSRVTGFAAADGQWRLTCQSGDKTRTFGARSVVNAAGPWAAAVAHLARPEGKARSVRLRLVKGSHIVVPRISGADDAYTFQNPDGRVVFALPFEGSFTMIGTTEEGFTGDPRHAHISPDEESYLIDVANRSFFTPISPSDIVWRFSGVRPLDDDGNANSSAVSRDYRFELDDGPGPPLLHVLGGKITTYRRLAENAVDRLVSALGMAVPRPDAATPLPGGDVGPDGFDTWFAGLERRYDGFAAATLMRLARRYGTRVERLLGPAKSKADLGIDLGGGLSERELHYLKSEEWARTADDVLWRRTKVGLHIHATERERVAAAIQKRLDAT